MKKTMGKKQSGEENIPLRKALRMNYRAIKIFWGKYPMMFITSMVSTVYNSLTPYVNIYLSALLISELAGGRNLRRLLTLAAIIVGAEVLLSLIRCVIERWKNYHNSSKWIKIWKMYVDKQLDMDFPDIDSSKTQELLSSIRQIEAMRGSPFFSVERNFFGILGAIVSICGALSLTVGLFISRTTSSAPLSQVLNNPLIIFILIVVMLAVTAIPPILSTKAGSYITKYSEEVKFGNQYFSMGFLGQDAKRAIDIRMYEQEKIIDSKLKNINIFSTKSILAKYARGPMGLFNAASSAISSVFTLIVYLFVCLKALAGAFGVGQVTQYIGAISALSGAVGSLLGALGDLKNNAVFLDKTFEFLDIPNNMYAGSITVEKRRDRNYQIEFRDVSFKYPGTDTYTLKNVNIKFSVGERFAVVGMNGSGKTTFIKLLCRLYDPTEGVILLNGIDIRKYDYREYMDIFSVVFQDFKLFSFSLAQNVAASVHYDSERVISCLKGAGLGKRLETLSHGIETGLYKDFDEDGVMISGGEAQKIALARALYKDSPFIILDEPTAALDPVAEYEIYSKFNEIVGDKTAIYISHRLSSCRFCDRIAVFDKGEIVQIGTHSELIRNELGKYHELWHAQSQYYTEQ